MGPLRSEKLIPLYSKGLLAASEFANGLLTEFVEDDRFDPELPAFVAGLPRELREGLFELLREVRDAGFQWSPLCLGPGGPILASAVEDSMRLRQIVAMFEAVEAHPHDGEIRVAGPAAG